jgi:hypothetical protein
MLLILIYYFIYRYRLAIQYKLLEIEDLIAFEIE